jgi:Fibronectin type III domain
MERALESVWKKSAAVGLVIGLLAAMPFTAKAGPVTKSVTVAWNPGGGPVAGYNIYYGNQSRIYTNVVSTGATRSATIPDLTTGKTYFFAATSVDSSGVESDLSAEASYAMPSPIPTIVGLSNQTMSVNGFAPFVAFTVFDAYVAPSNLTVTVTSSNPSLVPLGNVIFGGAGSNRTVQPNPLINQSGTSTITLVVNDGTGTTATNSFLLTVLPNKPPTLDPIANVIVAQNAGPQTVNLSGVTSGSVTETQNLSIIAVSSNPSLIPNPSVNYVSPNTTGTLTFAPTAGATGSSTISVTVDDGQNQNHTFTQSFVVTVETSQTITFTQIPQHKTADAPFALAATASSGLAVSFGVVSGHASLNGNMLKVTGWGWVTVSASQAGNGTYAPAPMVTQSFFVTPPTNAIGSAQQTTNGFQMAFYGVPGQNYTLQASTDARHWQNLFDFMATNSPTYVTDTTAANYAQRFYRMEVSNPRPAVTSPSWTAGGFSLLVQGPIGSNYVVQASTNMANWQTITNFKSTASPTAVTDVNAKNFKQRFYRVQFQ